VFNKRPVENPNMQLVLEEFQRLCRYYDLVGACMVVDAKESAYTYNLFSTFNAIIEDETLPMGFRIRLKATEQGKERAQELAQGTAWTFCALLDFGTQTRAWMKDFISILRRSGLQIKHNPFNGQKLERIGGMKR
jgi:hypothetical protein